MDGTGHRDTQPFVFWGKLGNQAKFWQRGKILATWQKQCRNKYLNQAIRKDFGIQARFWQSGKQFSQNNLPRPIVCSNMFAWLTVYCSLPYCQTEELIIPLVSQISHVTRVFSLAIWEKWGESPTIPSTSVSKNRIFNSVERHFLTKRNSKEIWREVILKPWPIRYMSEQDQGLLVPTSDCRLSMGTW